MKKEVILITGANGLVAKRLAVIFAKEYELRFLTRKKRNKWDFEWDIKEQKIDVNALINVNHIIHLSGAGIADKRWTKSRKEIIKNSRVHSAKLILKTLIKNEIKITSFISASAIGFYGNEISDKIFTENNKKGGGFLSDVCYAWENIAFEFTKDKASKRTVIIRSGIILSKNGGVLKKMSIPIKYYLGAILGNGNQYMPWIHIDDLCSILKYLVDNKSLTGIYNAVAPEHITNIEFTQKLAKQMKKSIFLPNIPSFIIRLIFGSSSVLLLKGGRVSSKKIIEKGFKFKYENLKKALQNL